MKPYKELRKKLTKEFRNPYSREYQTLGAMKAWLMQNGIKPTDEHIHIICVINGGAVYPYQKADRRTVIKYLKKHKGLK